jgi:hypothetical protein
MRIPRECSPCYVTFGNGLFKFRLPFQRRAVQAHAWGAGEVQGYKKAVGCVDMRLSSRTGLEPLAQGHGQREIPVKVFIYDIRVISNFWVDTA